MRPSKEDRGLGSLLATAEWVPWVVMPVLFVGFWVTEAWVHATLFSHRSFVDGVVRPDAHEAWMRVVVAAMFCAVAALWSRAIRERTEHIRALEEYQARLRDMGAELSLEEGDERQVFSERLHEHAAQTLAGARMYLAAVEPADEHSREALGAAQAILDQAIAECRDVAHELSPPALELYGLIGALEDIARRVASRAGVTVAVDADDDVLLGHDVLHMAYRVSAALIEDAARDPLTSAIRVRAHRSGSELQVELEWDAPYRYDLFAACELMAHVGGAVERLTAAEASGVVVIAPAIG